MRCLLLKAGEDSALSALHTIPFMREIAPVGPLIVETLVQKYDFMRVYKTTVVDCCGENEQILICVRFP